MRNRLKIVYVFVFLLGISIIAFADSRRAMRMQGLATTPGNVLIALSSSQANRSIKEKQVAKNNFESRRKTIHAQNVAIMKKKWADRLTAVAKNSAPQTTIQTTTPEPKTPLPPKVISKPVVVVKDNPPKGRVSSSPPKGRVSSSPPKGKVSSNPPKGKVSSNPPKGKVSSNPPDKKGTPGTITTPPVTRVTTAQSKLATADPGKLSVLTPGGTPDVKPIAVAPLQSLTFALVDPQGHPATNVPVTVSLELPDGTRKTLPEVKTGSDGTVRLPRVGSVPFVLSLGIADQDSTGEWSIQDPKLSEMVIEEPMGTQIDMIPPQDTPAKTATPIYEAETQKIVVERTILPLAIHGTPGTRLSGAVLPTDGVTIPESGIALVKLPLEVLREGPLPLRAARPVPGGECETVVRDYPINPYAPAEVTIPPLRLCRVSGVQMPPDIDVLDPIAIAQETHGDISARRKPAGVVGTVDKSNNGVQWWHWTKNGFSVQTREVFDRTPLIERVRLEKPEAGTVGGIAVGMPVSRLIEAFGSPQDETTSEKHWLDGGLAVGFGQDRVTYLELRRPRYLLERGCGAFVPRESARLFIESFEGNPQCPLKDATSLSDYLARSSSVRIVKRREDADFVLRGKILDLQITERDLVAKVTYYYRCRLVAELTLEQTATGKLILDRERIESSSSADVTTEAVIAGLGIASADVKGLLIGGIAYEEARKTMRRAKGNGPILTARTVLDRIVQRIERIADTRAAVLSINRGTGHITITRGAQQGLFPSTPSRRCDLELTLEGIPLGNVQNNNDADVLIARVVSVSEDSAECELRRIHRRVREGAESFDDRPAPKEATRLPEPACGLLSARVSTRFLRLDSSTDSIP